MIAAGCVTLGVAGAGIGITISRQDPAIAILSCQETLDLLPRYVDGTLTSVAQQKAVQLHLKHCEMCREYFEATY